MKKTKITTFENLCLKCDSGIIERIQKETDGEHEIKIKKCSNKKCLYQYGLKEFSREYTCK